MFIFRTKRTLALERIATALESLVSIIDTGNPANITADLITIGKDFNPQQPSEQTKGLYKTNHAPWEEDEVRERYVEDGFR